jgi:hypothetical protein
MPFPVAKVSVAFNDGPYVVSPTWTDITSSVRSMSTDRGRSDDWGTFNGSATVVLNNRERLYDPFYTSGTYYGKLLPRRQIKIEATYGATTYPVFRGFIDGWPPTWTDAGGDSTVTLSCFDALSLLSAAPMPPVWSSRYINDLGAEHFWKLDDPIIGSGAITTFTDSGTRATNLTSSAIIYQVESLASGIPDTCAGSLNNLFEPYPTNPLPVPWGTYGSVSFSLWTRNNQVSASGSLMRIATNGLTFEMFQSTSSAAAGQYTFRIRNLSIGYEWFSTAQDLSEPHHIVFTYNSATGQGLVYIDGIAQAPTRLAYSTLFGGFTFEEFLLALGEFQHVASFNKVLTPTEASTIYQYSLNQLSETTSQRETRIIGYTPFSTSMTSFAGTQTVLDLPPDLSTATSQLQIAADSEYGFLFANKAGIVTTYTSNQIRTQTKSIVSQAQYGNGVAFSGNGIGTDVQLQYAGDSMRNIADVSCTTAGTVTVTNTTSVNTYGSARESLSTVLGTLSSATSVGQIVSGWGGQVYPLASPIEVVVSPDASWATTLDLELLDRFTLQVTPPTGNAITNYMLTSRISHSVSPGTWVTTLEGSARWAAVFILNQSTLGGTDLLG